MAVQWYSVDGEDAQERLVAAWEDAPIENLETLAMLLSTAKRQVIAYAPALVSTLTVDDEGYVVDDTEYPDDYALAQLNMARDLWNAGRTDASGSSGAEGFFYKPLSLSKETKRIIRPVIEGPDVY